MQQALRWLDAQASGVLIKAHGDDATGGSRVAQEPIDVDRSRKVTFGRIARKPAPMLVLSTLTVKMTVKVCDAAANTLRINSLEGSLMIEWVADACCSVPSRE
jgi:hypothetical protein